VIFWSFEGEGCLRNFTARGVGGVSDPDGSGGVGYFVISVDIFVEIKNVVCEPSAPNEDTGPQFHEGQAPPPREPCDR